MKRSLKEQFIAGSAKIAYAEWSERGGKIIAAFKNGHWCCRHESEKTWQYEAMTEARAAYIFPTDAVPV